MNQELRKAFTELKAKCDTKAKRKAYNELVSTFSKSETYNSVEDLIEEMLPIDLAKNKVQKTGIVKNDKYTLIARKHNDPKYPYDIEILKNGKFWDQVTITKDMKRVMPDRKLGGDIVEITDDGTFKVN